MLELQRQTLATENISVSDFIAADGFPLDLEPLNDNAYAAALFIHSARLYPFAPSYLQAQLTELLGQRMQSQLNTLARCCALLGKQRHNKHQITATLARFAHHHHFKQAAEYISRALINQQYLREQRQRPPALDEAETDWQLPFAVHDDIKPVPATLMRALLKWPQNDKLFEQALHTLQQQPALTNLLCRYATAYTPQGRQLELKPSLLLLGPERSRELVLLAHFESNLSKPVFPLRSTLLKRRALIQQCLHRLANTFSVRLPCRAELIAYLLVYDAWRSPRWTTATKLVDIASPPWRVSSWIGAREGAADHRVSLRLCRYWQMPQNLSLAIQLQHPDMRVNAVVALSVASVASLSASSAIHTTNAENHPHAALSPWLSALQADASPNSTAARYQQAIQQAAVDAHYASELRWVMRP